MNTYQKWFLASRPWSFTLTAVSVSVGSVLGSMDGSFSWFLYLLTLAGVIFMHAAANLFNDYYDVLSGVDTLEVSTAQYRPHPLVEGSLKPKEVFIEALCLFILAALVGIFLVVTRGWTILIIAIIGAFAGVFYTAPPLKYKYRALGEISTFLIWGPLMVGGAYFVQRQTLSMDAFLISIPIGILVALVLLANNIRDVESDEQRGIKTLPIIAGCRKGIWIYVMLVELAYLSVILMALAGPLTLWSLIVLISLPMCFNLLRQTIKDIPIDADAQTAKLNTLFGILLLISLIIERLT
ncbi:MAG: 1,4-dihydroxy-2-naphthoate octaprenyltransferase [Thermodesulfobacteriota bacterium]|nr:1,4-dihydroxy-2-naphthoate octaprenyltransferase [Thermodesulfobacteriota bacterium]